MVDGIDKIGRYEILDKLGQGAMGIVYKAMDPLIGRIVALKTMTQSANLPEEQRKEFANRFFREAQSAGALQHANIVTIYDMGEDNGIPFIAMEFVEGKSLAKLIEETGKIPAAEAIPIIKMCAEGLSFAHEKGIVHRDIKPDNILIDRNNRAVVTDFGIAHLEESSLTRTGEVLGTPFFMSPEQILEGKLDRRSDLFSLGVVFYLMLTGRRPFKGETISSICYHIVHTTPDPLPPDDSLPAPILSILGKLLEKDPDKRYASGKDLSADLEKVLGGLTMKQAEQTFDAPGSASPPAQKPPGQAAPMKAQQKQAAEMKSGPPKPAELTPAGDAPKKKSSAVPIIVFGGILFVIFIAALAGGGYYLYTKGFFGAKGAEKIEEPPAAGEEQPPAEKAEAPATEAKERETAPSRESSSREKAPEKPRRQPEEKPERREEPKIETPAVTPPPPPPVTAADTKPAAKKGKIGVVFETKISEITLKVIIDGDLMIDEICTKDGGARIEQEFKYDPGPHNIRVIVQATKFPPFIREGSCTIDLLEGGHQVIKIEPSRRPTPRLTIKKIDVKTGQSTVIMEK